MVLVIDSVWGCVVVEEEPEEEHMQQSNIHIHKCMF